MKRLVVLILCLFCIGFSNMACEKEKPPGTSDRGSESQTSQGKSSENSPLPPPAQLASRAWDAYNKEDYKQAIAIAEECIDKYIGAANYKQLQLEKDQTPPSPIGAVSDEDKEAVFALGPLNDVATCYYIKASSLEALGHKEDAIKAYRVTAKFTYARCWDPQGWFWSPAEGALGQLSIYE